MQLTPITTTIGSEVSGVDLCADLTATLGEQIHDALVERAAAAGGRIGDTDDYPFIYQRPFDDLDGYPSSPYWLKPDPDPAP